MQCILIVIAVYIFIRLIWNLMHYYMERRFQRSFGFAPPSSKDKHAIRAYQSKVDRRLRELAATVAEDKAGMSKIVDQMSEFPLYAFFLGRLTPKGRELRELRDAYNRLTRFDLARGDANFFDFQVRNREDYL